MEEGSGLLDIERYTACKSLLLVFHHEMTQIVLSFVSQWHSGERSGLYLLTAACVRVLWLLKVEVVTKC